jgi:GGDEF domain-containing protein
VADAPIDGLLSSSEELAKGWLLALLEQAPLDAAPGILAADLSRDGPRLCEAALRALVSDNDLRRLESGGALEQLASRAGQLAGADGPESTSRAVDALQAVIWAGLSAELRDPEPTLVADLAGRLALVAEQLGAAALRRGQATAGGRSEPPPMRVAPTPAQDQTAGAASSQPLWISALEEEIRGAGAAPLSLLLTELEEADRVTAVETATEANATFSEFAQAVRSVMRRQDILVSETESRAWIIARDTGRAGAQALGARLAEAVHERRPWRGAAMAASVGLAVLGEDGRSSAELIDAAEEARFAAAAAGTGVIRAVPGDDPEN